MKINDSSITSSKNNIANGIIAGVRFPDFNARYAFNKKKTKTTDKEYAEFYDENGEQVARYSNGRWILLNTKKETARQIAMCNIYNREYGRL